MIGSLTGRVEHCAPGEVIVHVGGVGYRVSVPLSTYGTLPRTDQECRLHVVTVVREDEISLYGFATADEEELFRLLQGVNGVGPRLALKILGGLEAQTLRQALSAGDLVRLTSISGVGKKLAQRLVVELRDKAGVAAAAAAQALEPSLGIQADALEALQSLGYPPRSARDALRKAQEEGVATVEGLVREALKTLAPRR